MKRLLKKRRTRRPCAICDEKPQLDSLCWQHADLRLWRNAVEEGVKSDWEPMQIGKHPEPSYHQREMLGHVHGRTAWMVDLCVVLSGKSVLLDDTGRDSAGDRSVSRGDEGGVTA